MYTVKVLTEIGESYSWCTDSRDQAMALVESWMMDHEFTPLYEISITFSDLK